MTNDLNELRSQLQSHRQELLLHHLESLDSDRQTQLLEQIESIDFDQLSQLISQAISDQAEKTEQNTLDIAPLENVCRLPESTADQQQWTAATTAGEKLLAEGKVGAILVAGGQGSRLGFPHPKGMFPIGPVTDRTLFQIFFEQLLALSNRYGVRIPYFIMTSDATHQETDDFLRQHSWFGYPPEDLFLFRQGKMPAVDDQTGAVLLADDGQIAMSPDGHGGMLKALKKAGLIDEMHSRGIEYLFYHQVDNPCVEMCSASMLGLHHQAEAEISTKVVAKRDASEKVGVLAQVNGQQGIIEYSDLSEQLAAATDEQGRLIYWAGNIAIHIFNVNLLARLTETATGLPIHIAHKKVGHLAADGSTVTPEAPNAYKFEHFIFDAIPLAKNALVIETSRQREFNPVKNAEGSDSPATAKAALSANGRTWLTEAGYDVADSCDVEISPLVALSASDLAGQITAEQLTGEKIVISADGNGIAADG